MNEPLDVAHTLAEEAGDILMQYFGTTLTRSIKTGPKDFVTEADIASEKHILTTLKEQFPHDSIIAEESGTSLQQNAEYTWIIDPLDGTLNFAQEVPDFAVMIARARGTTIDVAVLYNPAKKIWAQAVEGGGTYINDERMTALPTPTTETIAAAKASKELLDRHHIPTTVLMANHATLALLTGEISACCWPQGKLWDRAVPFLLFKEAGFTTTTTAGTPYLWKSADQTLLAANPVVHARLLEIVDLEPPL